MATIPQPATKRLIDLVGELKAPKTQYNSFAKYYYRNIEDIQDAFKPLGIKYNFKLTFVEEKSTVFIGGVQETSIDCKAIIKCGETGEVVDTGTGSAIIQSKKGMDLPQATGTATSYARKYAAGSVLNIDDTKDSDYAPVDNSNQGTCTQDQIDNFLTHVEYYKNQKGMAFDEFINNCLEQCPKMSNDQKNLIAQEWTKF